jgi:hypothetical protein
MLTNPVVFLHHVRQWINKNGQQTGEIVCPAMKQEQTRLRRNSHADLIRDLETGASFKTLFRKKYLDVTEQFEAIGLGQFMKKYDMTLNHPQPFLREWPRSQATSPSLLQELKDHMKINVTMFVLADAPRY